MGGRFSSDFEPLQGLKIGVPSGRLGETSVFKIVMIDDVNLCSKFQCTWKVYSILSILFYRCAIFKMLELEQSADKWTFLTFLRNKHGRMDGWMDIVIPGWGPVRPLRPPPP